MVIGACPGEELRRAAERSPGQLETALPGSPYKLPRIFDWHSYPRLFGVSSDTTSDPQGVESTYREAAASYSAFYNLIMSSSVKDQWIGQARLQISETHSPTSVKVGTGFFTCESNGGTPAVDSRLAFVGLRQSLAAGMSSDFSGTNIRPIYNWGNGWCIAPVPLDVKDNGYDKTQP